MKVSYLPYQPHCFAFGGFEVQMLQVLEAANAVGVYVSKLDYWERASDFEILHAWGLGTINYETINWAKKKDKKIVITALLPHYESLLKKIRHLGSLLIYTSKFSYLSLKLADKVIAVNDIQAELLEKYYRVHYGKIEIIPHIIGNVFFEENNRETSNNYILCTGNICRRKNQLNLAKACNLLGEELIIVGHVLDGEQQYALELENEIKKSDKITWIKGLKENSNELVELYANSKCFALISFEEQQPISALEAVAMNKPIILADKLYAKQKYFKNCIKSSTDYKGIARAIERISSYTNNDNYILECKTENVGLAYKRLYEQL